MNIGIKKTFGLLIIPLLIVLAIVGAVAWRSEIDLERNTEELNQTIESRKLAMTSRIYVSEMGSALKGYLLNPSNEAEVKAKKEADDGNAATLEALKKIVTNQDTLKLISAMSDLDEKQLNPAEEKTLAMVKSGDLKGAHEFFAKNYLPLRQLYDELSVALLSNVAQLATARFAQYHTDISRPIIMIIIAIATGFMLFAVAMGWTVRRMSGNFTEVVSKLTREADQVAQVSSEVSDSASMLSSSTTQQAAALQETAASLDELNAMVRRNSDSSIQSSRVARQSNESATNGRESVAAMTAAMKRIDTSNDDIIRQVEAGNKAIMGIATLINEIGGKTKVINDIVFQTKLLSFNASVEAARAGEHGKGFAVVAEEVGNLAQMSGTAAREISAILDSSIQKVEAIASEMKSRVDALVRAGRDNIATGVATADRCGASLDEIVHQAADLGRMVDDIATASQEQTKGLDEITRALAELDKAMNQSSVIAHTSADQGQNLRDRSSDMRRVIGDLSALTHGGKAQFTPTHSSDSPEASETNHSEPPATNLHDSDNHYKAAS